MLGANVGTGREVDLGSNAVAGVDSSSDSRVSLTSDANVDSSLRTACAYFSVPVFLRLTHSTTSSKLGTTSTPERFSSASFISALPSGPGRRIKRADRPQDFAPK